MKIKIILLMFLVSCTTYNNDSKLPSQDYRTVTTETINTNLKVIDIVVDQNKFDDMYQNYEEDIEITAFFNLYLSNEILIENEEIELKVKGTFSASFDLKSLGIKFERTYKNADNNYNLINPELLPFHNVDKIKSIRLRNSGNDFKGTMLKDISYTKLAINAGLDIDVMYAEQTVVFVNNVFLGVMNLRTEKNKRGISKLYDVSKDVITLAKIIEPGLLIKKDGDFEKIDAFIHAIEQRDFNYLINEIEPSNFIDYFIYESYIANDDWPKNNVVFFAIEDGPFRFLLFDLDGANKHNLSDSPFSFIYNDINNIATDLFDVLYDNNNFKTQYDVRWSELVFLNILSSVEFNAVVNIYKENIESVMHLQIDKYNEPETLTNWYIFVDELKENFKVRENYIN